MTDQALKFKVRAASPADSEKMLFLWQEANDMQAKVDKRYTLAPDAAARWQASLGTWLADANVAIFVAESQIKEGHLLGYIIGEIVNNRVTLLPERFGLVSDLAVDSHGKMSGIGRGLFDSLKVWFAEHGVTHVEARVPHRHPVAQAFWRALGASELYDQMFIKLP